MKKTKEEKSTHRSKFRRKKILIRLSAFILSFITAIYPATGIVFAAPDTSPSASVTPETENKDNIIHAEDEIPTYLADGDTNGLVTGNTVSVVETTIINQLTATQMTEIENTVENTNFSLEEDTDFYYLALYSQIHSTTNKSYKYMGSSSAPVTIPAQMTITIDGSECTLYYPGIGSTSYPFEGEIQCAYTDTVIKLGEECAALFGCLSSEATLFTGGEGLGSGLVLNCGSDTGVPSSGGLAHALSLSGNATFAYISVRGAVNNTIKGISLTVGGEQRYSFNTGNNTGALFGSVTFGSGHTLTVTNGNISGVTSVSASSNGSAGALIGKIDSGVSLALAYTGTSLTIPTAVTAVGGNAGGLVGTVEGSLTLTDGASFIINENITSSVGSSGGHAGGIAGKVTGTLTAAGALSVALGSEKSISATYLTTNQSGGASGGLVGSLTSGSVVLNGALTMNTNLSVSGGYYAGGFIGHTADNTSITRNAITVSGTVTAAGSNGSAGGFIGTAGITTITALDNTDFTFTGTVSGGKYDGGYIGRWISPVIASDQASACLTDSHIKIGTSTTTPVNITATDACRASGGLIGSLEGSTGHADYFLSGCSVYIQFNEPGNADIARGSLLGTVTGSVYCAVDGATNIYSNTAGTTSHGWIAGTVGDGCILNIGGTVTITAPINTGATNVIGETKVGAAVRFSGVLACTGNAKIKSVVYSQDSSLIYCESDWALTRNNTDPSDDIGNYGQIIRNGATGMGIISFTAPTVGTHASVTVSEISGATSSDVTVATLADFARLAITLSSRGVFSAINNVGYNEINTLLQAKITLSNSFDLSDTGIECLTRSNSTVFPFTGELDGDRKTVTLAIGRHYPDQVATLTDNTINHTTLGLFEALGNGARIHDLTVAGFIKGNTSNAAKIQAGGVAGTATGTVTINNVTSTVDIVCPKDNSKKTDKSSVGSILGSYTGTALTVTNSTADGTISLNAVTTKDTGDPASMTSNAGGIIGYIHANGNATINFSGCTISTNITSNNTCQYARVGGVVAVIETDDSKYSTLNLNTLIFSAPQITVSASNRTGGLLGFSWSRVNVEFKSTVNGTLAITGAANVGGLVHTVTGKFEMLANATLGYTLTRGVSGASGTSDSLVVCDGKSLYMKVSCAATFANNVVKTGFSYAANSLDYLVGNNVTGTDPESGIPIHGGIVSIETGAGFGVMPANGDAWYNLPKNKKTRYYYNLDSKATSGLTINDKNATISGNSDLLLYHLKKYVNGALTFTFATGNTGNFDFFHSTSAETLSFTADVNMTGMCFYPTTVDGLIVNLGGKTLTFAAPAADADVENPLSQHYCMMTGLLLDVNGSLTVNGDTGSTITGTVSKWGGTHSGAIVAGMITGSAGTTDTVINLDINNITASGLSVNGAAGALLINRIYTCVTVTFDNITAEGTTVSATALIGEAGGTVNNIDAKKLNITFSNMQVNGSNDTDAKKFTTASFIASLTKCSSCVYNFNIDTLTNGIVTYGAELGNNVTEYYDDTTKVHTPDDVYDFTSGYLRYVITGNISVNVKGGNLTFGCGTADDKYQIATYAQLISIMKIINGDNPDANFVVNYPDSGSSPHTHTEYTYTSGTTLTKTNDGNGSETLYVPNLRTWLSKAYYSITHDITTDAAFLGIGKTEAYKFEGHIDGGGNNITLSNRSDASDFGFICFANGCSLSSITFIYGAVSVSNAGNNAFGGAIGTVVDGDNILDNVTVTYTSLTVQNRLSYVGGYVGLVKKGGVIFKNINGDTNGTEALAANGLSSYYYANPFIGRVLDGYALSESVTLESGDKNYHIPTINNSDTTTDGAHGVTISRTGTTDTVTISSGEGLYFFSAAFNSGSLFRAGYLSTLINFAGNAGAGDTWNITLTGDCDVSTDYLNGFRGIGGLYTEKISNKDTNIGPAIKLGTLDGGNHYVKTSRSFVQYNTGETFYTANAGLINKLSVNNGASISNLIIRGKVELKVADSTNGSISTSSASIYVGGAVGNVSGAALTLTNVFCGGEVKAANDVENTPEVNNSLAVYGQGAAGGIVGYSTKALTFINCGYKNIKIEGYKYIGGFVGGTSGGAIVIYATEETTIENGLIRYLQIQIKNALVIDTGAGGLIGWTNSTININNHDPSDTRIKLSNIVVFSDTIHYYVKELGFGGVVGNTRQDECVIKKVDVAGAYILGYSESNVTDNTTYDTTYKVSDNVKDFTVITTDTANYFSDYFNKILHKRMTDTSIIKDGYYNPGIGGIIGSVGVNQAGITDKTVTLDNVNVYSSANSYIVFVGGNSSGGLIGDYRFTGVLTITNSSFNANIENQVVVGGDALIVSGTRASGIVAYLRGRNASDISAAKPLSAENLMVGCDGCKTLLLSTISSTDCYSGGITAEVYCGATITEAIVQNCVIAGNYAAGAVGLSQNGNVALTDITIKNSIVYSKSSYAGSIISKISKGTVYMNQITSDNNIIVSCKNNFAGGLIGNTASAVKIYGNQILLKNNLLAEDTFSHYPEVVSKTFTASTDAGGLIAGTTFSGSTVNLLGFCRTETETGTAYNEIGIPNSVKPEIVYSSYGSLTNNDIATDQKLAPLDNDTTYGGLSLWGDALFTDRAVTLNNLSWWKASSKWTAGTYDALEDRLTTYNGIDTTPDAPALPLFNALGTGNGVDAVTEYLDLLTNGGFSAWTGNKSVTSVYYTYSSADHNFTASTLGGSIVWSDNALTLGDRYDNITPGGEENTFTLLTITFTNKNGSETNDNISYTMTLPVYFPQVLQMTTNIIPLGFEEYSVSAFLNATNNPNLSVVSDIHPYRQASAMKNGFFSMYIEYMYNEVRDNDNWNMDKRLIHYQGTASLPENTMLILIDLNATDSSGKYGKAYSFNVPAGFAGDILWSDFSQEEYEYIPLKDLKSVNEYTTTGEAIFNSSETSGYGIERYLLIGQFPSSSTNSAEDYSWTADVVNNRNIQIERTDNRVIVKAWDPATLNVTSAQSETGIEVLKDTGISAFVNAEIKYSTGYADYEGNKSAWYGVFTTPWLTAVNGESAIGDRVSFPVGTQVSFNGPLNEDLLTNSDTVSRSFSVNINLDNVNDNDYKTFSTAADYYNLHIKFYLTQDINNPQSGIEAEEIVIKLTTNKVIPLSITVMSQNNDLGVNVYAHEYVNIDFNVFADTSNYSISNDSILKLRFHLTQKTSLDDDETPFVTVVSPTPNHLLTSTNTDSTVVSNSNDWELTVYNDNDNINLIVNSFVSVNMNFESPDSKQLSYNSYKLSAELVEITGGEEKVLSNTDYFIFLVARIKTEIGNN